MREWLKELRKDKGYTQEYVALKLGVSRVSYTNIENGKRKKKLDIEFCEKISCLYNIPLSEISEKEKEIS